MENKVPYSTFTLRVVRSIQLAKEGLPNLLLGLICLLVLNSCSKEAALDEVSPSSVETTTVLREWATKNDKLNQANLIEWDNSIPILLSDSIKGYSAPVKTASGFKEFIAFEIDGKKHGWYKSYKFLKNTQIEIKIQSISGEILRAGIVRKVKSQPSKGKSFAMREMNYTTSFWSYIIGTLLQDVTVTAPRLYPTDNYVYLGTYQFELKAFYDPDGYIGGAGGMGSSSLTFDSYDYPEITNNLTNDCFIQVLNELTADNLKGKIACIIEQYDATRKGSGYDFTIDNNLNLLPTKEKGIRYGQIVGTNIRLNMATLANTSKELIATTIIHEVLHAHLKGIDEEIDHIKIAQKFVEPIAILLNELYNMDIRDARILATTGLSSIPENIFSKVLASLDNKNPITEIERKSVINNFAIQSNSREYGTSCN